MLDGGTATVAATATVSAATQARAVGAPVHPDSGIYAGHLGTGRRHTANRATCFRPLQTPFRKQRAIASRFQIQVVFDGQGDGVGQSETELASTDERGEAGGVGGTGFRDDWSLIPTKEGLCREQLRRRQ